jgi:hypothetical protein
LDEKHEDASHSNRWGGTPTPMRTIKTSFDEETGWTVTLGKAKASTQSIDSAIGQLVMRNPDLFDVRLDRTTKKIVREWEEENIRRELLAKQLDLDLDFVSIELPDRPDDFTGDFGPNGDATTPGFFKP